MTRSAMCVALLILTAAAATASAQETKADGEKVFAAQKCSLCHSVAGKGNVKGALDEVGSKLSNSDIGAWITDAKGMTEKTHAARKPAMKSYTLSKADVDALTAYLSAMKKK